MEGLVGCALDMILECTCSFAPNGAGIPPIGWCPILDYIRWLSTRDSYQRMIPGTHQIQKRSRDEQLSDKQQALRGAHEALLYVLVLVHVILESSIRTALHRHVAKNCEKDVRLESRASAWTAAAAP